jgi:hypothetical protein
LIEENQRQDCIHQQESWVQMKVWTDFLGKQGVELVLHCGTEVLLVCVHHLHYDEDLL